MKLQRTAGMLLLLALLLGGGVYVWEKRSQNQPQTEAAQGHRLFNFQEKDIQKVTLKTLNQTLVFERIAIPKTPETAWQLKSPVMGTANDGAIAYLLNLLATGTKEPLGPESAARTLTIPMTRRAEFGLDRPLATIEATLTNQTQHRVILGKPNFNETGLYAEIDPPASTETKAETAIALLSMDWRNAVNRPLSEWQQANPTNSATPAPPTPNKKL